MMIFAAIAVAHVGSGDITPNGDEHYDKFVELRAGTSINKWRAMSSLRNGLRSMVMMIVVTWP